jgi:hypothetical protein
MNPQDVAAARYREIRRAKVQIAKTESALAKATERPAALRHELALAEGRDRAARAAALVAGKSEASGHAPRESAIGAAVGGHLRAGGAGMRVETPRH